MHVHQASLLMINEGMFSYSFFSFFLFLNRTALAAVLSSPYTVLNTRVESDSSELINNEHL